MLSNRTINEWAKRVISFVFSLFILGIGVSLAIRANLGSSPITCPPYVISKMPASPLTVGGYIFCMQFFFVLLQFALLRKNFQKIQFLQLGVCLLFGLFTDLGMWLTEPFQWSNTPMGYIARWIQLAISGVIIGVGVIWEVKSDVLLIPGEGLPVALSKVFHIDFGKVKIMFDVFLVTVAVACCYIIFDKWRWDLVGLGTLFSMFYVGIVVRIVSPHMDWLDKWLSSDGKKEDITSNQQGEAMFPLIITISRQYGSGGHEIGEKLATALQVPLLDKDIVDKTAEELGYTIKEIIEKEQKISEIDVLEMIFADGSGILPEMELSEEDAIFVTESRIIRNMAKKGPCVVIGRCADFLFKDNPNCFRVFIRSDKESAHRRVINQYHISEDKADDEINRVNQERANHYWRYTRKHWGNTDNYDLVVNSSKIGIDGAVNIIKEAISI